VAEERRYPGVVCAQNQLLKMEEASRNTLTRLANARAPGTSRLELSWGVDGALTSRSPAFTSHTSQNTAKSKMVKKGRLPCTSQPTTGSCHTRFAGGFDR